MQETKQKSNGDIVESLRIANGLTYDIGRSLNVAKESNWTKEDFIVGNNGIVKAGKSALRVLNTASAYVDGYETYLCLNLKVLLSTGASLPTVDATNYIWFGNHNSALSLVDEIHIKSKDGVDVELSRKNGIIREIFMRNTHSKNYLHTVGNMFGVNGQDETEFSLGPGGNSHIHQGNLLKAGWDLCIPMRHLSGLFSYNEKLLPSQLCAGMSISFTFAPMEQVFSAVGNFTNGSGGFLANLTYEVSDIFLRMKTYELSDAMQSKLASISESEGLKILFNTFYDESQAGVTTRANINIRKNIAQAIAVYARSRSKVIADSVENSPTSSGANQKYTSVQFRHGSENFPRDVIKREDDLYAQTHFAFSKHRKTEDASSIDRTYDYFSGSFTTVGYDFQKSNMGLSGVALSNSKTITMNAEYNYATVAEEKIVDLFLLYSRLLSIYISNCVAED